jgi:hypothetical protein
MASTLNIVYLDEMAGWLVDKGCLTTINESVIRAENEDEREGLKG